ncbi:MAG: hypothetical protein CVV64_03530 [Candidatus Wallbacteria bacterium HGW-Wallbacteria-1]|jgi:TatD DNase family protein|uniref:Hydrolase TatD n=1 Tax=Candidatus Wallbacteria bacterium HGW-Wallbacteria-1 TaxID=2013854 RepID=A0A2N1PTW9_9BACT|nr:MAG: hypothetical protein CVV64_03530 [Candidatus Wallbacteria bacterium HGW-Wallbacteria-1]
MSRKKRLPVPHLPVPVVDSHAHVFSSFFQEETPAQIMARAGEVNVVGCVNVGTDLKTTEMARQVAEEISGVFFTAGLHPHDARFLTDQMLSDLKRHCGEGAVAVGEIGLDFHYNHSPAHLQELAFEAQLDLAALMNLPVIVHSREADVRTLEILRPWFDKCSIMLHCFSGNLDLALKYVDLGAWLSLPGVITYSRNIMGREVLSGVPTNRLMFETDCPFLTPEPRRGRTNEPAFLAFTLAFAAEFLGRDLETVCVDHMTSVRDFFRFDPLLNI